MRLVVDYKHGTKELTIKTSDGQLFEYKTNKDFNILIEPSDLNYINPDSNKYR